MYRAFRSICCALIALVAALALSSCNWTGEGKDVAAAIVATSQVKTRAFSGELKMDMSKMTGAASAGAQAPSSMVMSFSGAMDSTNPAAPKMVMNMQSQGQTTTTVAPGDGKLYVSVNGKSYSIPLPPEAASDQTINPQEIYVALGEAVGDFQKAPQITNPQGKAVDTISATVNKSKLCGPVLEAFGDAMGKTTGLDSAFRGNNAGTATSSSAELEKNSKKLVQTMCKSMLTQDPRVWFGIDAGKLTDVVLSAQLTIPFAGPMGIEVQYHEFNQNQPQAGFDPPANAVPVSSIDALPLS
jgi:predicted small secreted protein